MNELVREVKAYLSERFSKTVFRVQRQWGEAGMLLAITWTDGASLTDVQRCGVSSKFTISIDISVSISRLYSAEARKWGEEELKRKYHEDSIAKMASWDRNTMIWRLLSYHSFEEAK